MSIWTSSPKWAALAGAVLTLVACGGAGPLRPLGSPPQHEVSVTSDNIVVTGPDGFCVDPTSTSDRGSTAFVLLGNCAVISNQRSAGQPDVQAVLTASVSDADPDQSLRESIPELDRFFQSADGRQLLSRDGDADSVEILDSFHQGDVYFIHARDSSAGDIQDVSDEYWRSYLDVGPRIATLTVLGTDGGALSSETGLSTLRSFTNAVLGANENAGNAALPTAPVAVPTVPTTTPAPASNGTLWNIGLFRRIL